MPIVSPNNHEIYPGGIWHPIAPVPAPAHPGFLSDRNLIVDHITEGGPEVKNSLAWYENLLDKKARYGAHFYIGQQGEVYQTSLIGQTTWHASQVNQHSIGIEHAASSGSDPKVPALSISELQYKASAKLHAWISKTAGIPLDRNHVRSHWEASPADLHTHCCMPTLDLDKLVAMAKVLLV